MTGRDPTRPSLTTRAETVPVDALGHKRQDARTGEELVAALKRETERSLREDPSRWRFAKAASPDHHRRRARRQPWRSTP
jgi:hypothetical protein